MLELEKILEELKRIKDGNRKEKLYAKYPPNSKDQEVLNAYSQGYEDGTDNFYNAAAEIIRKHMNDGWIPVKERLPEKNEYFADTSSDREFPNGYYRRLEIAYMTDTIGYTHGYYDGYKWMDEWYDIIKNVVAWKIHEPYRPERSSDEKE